MPLAFQNTSDLLTLADTYSGTTYDKFGYIVGVDYSDTSLTIDTVQQTLFLNADNSVDRDYIVGDIVLLTAKAGTTGTMLCSVALYTPNNQGLLLNVISTTGSGTGTSWRLTKALPRQDYNPTTGVLRGAHIEPASENLLTFSANASGDIVSGSITESVITTAENPEGTLSVRKLNVTATAVYRFGDTTSGISSTQYVGSVFIMTETGSFSVDVDCNGVNSQNFNVDNTGWTRVWAQGATANTNRYIDVTLPVGVYYVFGRQMESGFMSPTSYIPTDDVTETRDAGTHFVNTTELANILITTGYTLACEVEHEVPTDDNTEYTLFSLSDGTANNIVTMSLDNVGAASNSMKFSVVSGGVEVYSDSTANETFLPLNTYKAAIALELDNFLSSFSNTLGSADLTGAIPANLSELHIGSVNGTSNHFRGWVRLFELYPYVFDSASLLELTDTVGTPLTVV